MHTSLSAFPGKKGFDVSHLDRNAFCWRSVSAHSSSFAACWRKHSHIDSFIVPGATRTPMYVPSVIHGLSELRNFILKL